MPVSKMWESIEAQIQASLNTAQDHDGGPYPVYPSCKSRDETSREMGSGKKFFHNAISGAGFATQPTLSQLSLQSSITAWAAWKSMRNQQSWALTERQSGVCTQLVRSREACTATIDWEATLSWIALFSAVWQELLVQSTCWVTKWKLC